MNPLSLVDTIILITGLVLVESLLILAISFVCYWATAKFYASICNKFGEPLVKQAVQAYELSHPEEFKKYRSKCGKSKN